MIQMLEKKIFWQLCHTLGLIEIDYSLCLKYENTALLSKSVHLSLVLKKDFKYLLSHSIFNILICKS